MPKERLTLAQFGYSLVLALGCRPGMALGFSPQDERLDQALYQACLAFLREPESNHFHLTFPLLQRHPPRFAAASHFLLVGGPLAIDSPGYDTIRWTWNTEMCEESLERNEVDGLGSKAMWQRLAEVFLSAAREPVRPIT